MSDVALIIFLLFFAFMAMLILESVGLLLRRFGLLNANSRVLEPSAIYWISRLASKVKPFDWNRFRKRENKIHHRELLTVLLGLEDEKLENLLEFYKAEFGAGAARYARKTHRKWKKGDVRPIRQTFERFLVHLPKVMSYDLKCEVLRHLMEEYCAKDKYQLTVYTDNWEETLEPLVKKIIDKPYTAALPKQIEEKLKWLAEDETQIAQDILRKSQVEEGKIAVAMLRQEFAAIEYLLENTKGRRKVTHQLKFPYGTITLNIKSRLKK